MSGICGWIGRGRDAGANRELAEAMAAPLVGVDRQPPQIMAGAASAMAGAGAGVQCYEADGVRFMLWGEARLRGVADTIPGPAWTELWRGQGALALCEALTGAFALAVIDERAGEALLATDHMGSFPLLYQQQAETLVFASSAQSCAATR